MRAMDRRQVSTPRTFEDYLLHPSARRSINTDPRAYHTNAAHSLGSPFNNILVMDYTTH